MSATVEAIGRDQQLCLRILKAHRGGVCAIARKNRNKDRPDLCDCQRGDRRFGEHRQKQPDTVALADAQITKGVGRARNLASQFGESEAYYCAIFAFPDNSRLG